MGFTPSGRARRATRDVLRIGPHSCAVIGRCPLPSGDETRAPRHNAPHRSIVISAAAPINSAAGGGTPVETGGRDDHVRRTRSLSRRALGGDRDSGWLHRLRPRGAHPRDAGREPSRAAGGRRGVPRRSASGPCISSACWPRRCRPDTVYLVLPTIISFLICALVVGISLFFVSIGEPSLRRVVSSAVLLGAGIASMHYVGIHGLAGNFAIAARHPDGAAVGRDRDRRGLWRPARVPGAAGRHPR